MLSSDTVYANLPISKILSELRNRYIQIFPRGRHVIMLWGLVTHELLSSSAADKGLDSRRQVKSAWSGLGRLNRLSRSGRGPFACLSARGTVQPPCRRINVNAPNFAIRNRLGKDDACVLCLFVCVCIYVCVRVYATSKISRPRANFPISLHSMVHLSMIHDFTKRSYQSYSRALSIFV